MQKKCHKQNLVGRSTQAGGKAESSQRQSAAVHALIIRACNNSQKMCSGKVSNGGSSHHQQHQHHLHQRPCPRLTHFFISTLLTLAPKFKEHMVSSTWSSHGFIWSNISVLESPLSESCSMCVNGEFRNGV